MAVTVDRKSYYKIGELSKFLGLEPHIIRYWETLFPDIRPETTGTNRKLYTRSDLETLAVIRYLVREAQFSIEGAKQRIAELKRSGELSDLKLELVEYNDTKKTSSLAALNSIASRSSKKKDQDKTAVSDVVDEQIIQTPDDQSDIQALQHELEERQANIQALQTELDQCKSELSSARIELEADCADIEGLRSELALRDSELESLHNALEEAQNELHVLRDKMNQQSLFGDTSITSPSQAMLTLRLDYEAAQKALKELNAKLSEQSQELENIRQTLKRYEQDLKVAQNEIKSRDELMDRANDLITSKTAEINGFETQLHEALDTISARDNELSAVHADLEARTSELVSANETIANRDSELASVHADLETRTSELASANETIAARDSELSAVHADL
ncbi:MAG: MerR family transcriptional regulator, partial [Proteobacteria bacterium]|nr:MerR family transcriptional regulator [Pseudomonadota bacterium]